VGSVGSADYLWRHPRHRDSKLGGLVAALSSRDGQGEDFRECGVSGDPVLLPASHDWPPPPPCGLIAVFGCDAAPFPLAVQSADWLDLAGPVIGLALAVGALAMRKDPAEGGILWTLLVRFALPVVGLVVSVGCAIQLWSWINQ
jgi:hypothetical protein